MSARPASERLSEHRAAGCDVGEVERALRVTYGAVPPGSAPLGNKRNPLDELVFIQLSVRTPDREYEANYRALRRLTGGRWERLLTVDEEQAVAVLRTGGMARIKVQRLRDTFIRLRERFGRVTLAPLKRMDDGAAEAVLLDLPGVGPKVARCILLYSLDREVFPVDTHCFRVLERLGIAPAGRTYRQSHDALQELVPPTLRRSLHVNLIHHGRGTCTPHQPRCPTCVLVSCCPTGLRRIAHPPDAPVGAGPSSGH